jgi:ATP synthase protein I
MPQAPNPPPPRLGKLALLATVGLMFPASIAIGSVVGYFLDRWLGSFPWLSLLFFVFGVAAAVVNLLRVLKQLEDDT